MEKEIKELRVKIDGLAQLTESLTFFEDSPANSKETKKHYDKFPEHKGNPIFVTKYKLPKNIESTYQSLYLAKAWLGKVLAELGSENPYKSGYKTKEDIEPTADVAKPGLNTEEFIVWMHKDFIEGKYDSFTYIEKIDWLRTEIEKLIIVIKEIQFLHSTRELNIARTNSYNYLCEAKFYLGFELQKIKES